MRFWGDQYTPYSVKANRCDSGVTPYAVKAKRIMICLLYLHIKISPLKSHGIKPTNTVF